MFDRVILKNISSLFSLRIAGYIIPLITLPYLVRILEPEGFGTFAFCTAIIQYFIILVNYGFDLSATKKISESKDNKHRISAIYWNVMYSRLILAVSGFFVLCLVGYLFSETGGMFIVLLVLYISVIGEACFAQWLFQGKEQLGAVSILRVLSQLSTIPFIFVFVNGPSDILVLSLLTVIPVIITASISTFIIARRGWISWYPIKASEIKETLSDGWHLFISTAAVSIYTTSIVVILGVISGPVSVAIFASANKLLQAALSLYSPITASFYPRINSLMQESRSEALDLIRYVTIFQLKFTFFISVCIFFASPIVVHILYGSSYEDSVDVLRIMSFLPVIVGISNVLGVLVLVPHGYKKQFSGILILSGLVSLVSIVPLCYFYGANGAALSVLVTESIVTFLMFAAVRKKNIFIFESFRVKT